MLMITAGNAYMLFIINSWIKKQTAETAFEATVTKD
jgi:hypothetical protein